MKPLVCRACLAPLGKPFLMLGNQPLSNAYLKPDVLAHPESVYPLDVYCCTSCHLVQLPEFEAAENIFNEEYAYFSSYSTTWLNHCRQYADMATSRFNLTSNSFVIEVASNDGYLLQYFKDKGIPVLGVEPAAATARVAIAKGVPTDICFFDVPYAKKLVVGNRQADLIAGNNVLAHNPNLRDFVEALKIALKPNGVITLEFPHLLCMMRENQFDTIYHEHYSYLALHSLVQLFNEFGLTLFDVDQLPTHGGSLRLYACHDAAHRTITGAVARVLSEEKAFGLLNSQVYEDYSRKIEQVKKELLDFLASAKAKGQVVAGYGAPAKGNTILNYCGATKEQIAFTVDRNPQKQNRFLPGSHIPIFSTEKIQETKPNYILILPWNIKDEITEQMKCIREWGGRFVVAIPKLEVF